MPRILEEAGMLAALYTDSTTYSTLGQFARYATKIGIHSSRLASLSARIPNGIPRHKVFSSDRLLWSYFTKGLISSDLSKDFNRWGFNSADIVYSMYGEDCKFLELAKSQGLKIIIDVFCHPNLNKIMRDIYEKYSVTGPYPNINKIPMEDAHSKHIFDLGDMLLCPSEWVASGVKLFSPEHTNKIRIVPYGSSLPIIEGDTPASSSNSKYFLFAGRTAIGKGLCQVAEAAENLSREYPDWKTKVAGLDSRDVSWMRFREHLQFLGKVPLDKMRSLYQEAYAFVFPSFCEGQAGVVLEALTYGCPVITTKASGVDLKGVAGITIPPGDSKALLAAMLNLIETPKLQRTYAQGAFDLANNFYTLNAWSNRLVDALSDCHSTQPK